MSFSAHRLLCYALFLIPIFSFLALTFCLQAYWIIVLQFLSQLPVDSYLLSQSVQTHTARTKKTAAQPMIASESRHGS